MAADTCLNFGESFENWCIEIPHKQLRPDTPKWGG